MNGLLRSRSRVNKPVHQSASDREGEDGRSCDQRHAPERRQRESPPPYRLLARRNLKHTLTQLR
jgi:hypothetical protein